MRSGWTMGWTSPIRCYPFLISHVFM